MFVHFLYRGCIPILDDFKIISDEFSLLALLLPEKQAAVLGMWQLPWDDMGMLTSQICRLMNIKSSLMALD